MLKKKNNAAMDTIIGENTTVNGNVESDSSIKVMARRRGYPGCRRCDDPFKRCD